MAALSKLEESKISRPLQEERELHAAAESLSTDSSQRVPAQSSQRFPVDSLSTSLPALFTMVGLALAAATFVNLPLGFDGSYYVLKLLDESTPYVPHNRLGNILLQLPALLASNIGDRLTPAVMAFSFTYAVIPLLCLLGCYLIVRNHNRSLMMWPAISMAMVSVVLGPVMISENLIASELAWLLVLGIITPANSLKSVALVSTGIFMATLHPCSVLYLGFAALLSWRYKNSRLTFSLLAVAAARFACAFLFPAPYEADTLSSQSWGNYGFRFIMSPLMYVEAYAIACGVLFLKGKNIALGSSYDDKNKKASLRRFKAAIVVMLIGLTIGVLWSCESTMWDHAFFGGRFIVIPSMVLMLCAVVDHERRSAHTAYGAQSISRYRTLITNLAFFGIMCQMLAACSTWVNVKRWVENAMQKHDAAVIDIDAQKYPYGSPLAHWSTGSLSILMQGRSPRHVMLKSQAVPVAREKGEYTINSIEPPLMQTWFHLPAGESARRQAQ